jgi:hypothetical protein
MKLAHFQNCLLCHQCTSFMCIETEIKAETWLVESILNTALWDLSIWQTDLHFLVKRCNLFTFICTKWRYSFSTLRYIETLVFAPWEKYNFSYVSDLLTWENCLYWPECCTPKMASVDWVVSSTHTDTVWVYAVKIPGPVHDDGVYFVFPCTA